MSFLFNKNSHFNLANIVTFFNIASGIFAIYFLTHHQFFAAALFAWLAGGFDIFDYQYYFIDNFFIKTY